MKKIIVFLFTLCLYMAVSAQLKTTPKCPDFDINILKGIVNEAILPNSTIGQIKLKFPCATGTEEEGAASKCGAGVFYKDKDVYFYTDRNYIEIGPNFKGKISLPLIGASRDNLFKWLGSPQVKDIHWDAFQTAYGLLILYYNKDSKVNKIQFSTETSSSIRLCD
ncbi:MAG: hypothetical protein ABI237_15005 [Ginsengibacter sp.]